MDQTTLAVSSSRSIPWLLLAAAFSLPACGAAPESDDQATEAVGDRADGVQQSKVLENPYGVVRVVSSTQDCSGILLDDWTVLTARSCLDDDPASVDVTLKTESATITTTATSFRLHGSLDAGLVMLGTRLSGYTNALYPHTNAGLATAFLSVWGYGGTGAPGFAPLHSHELDKHYLITDHVDDNGVVPVTGDRGGPCIGPTSLAGEASYVVGVLSGCTNDGSAPFYFDPGPEVRCWCLGMEEVRDWIHGSMHIDAVVYEDKSYRGAAQSLPTQGGQAGFHADQLDFDDEISSIHVPHGWEVEVFANDEFAGLSQTYTTDQSSLPIMNDAISALSVQGGVIAYDGANLTGAWTLLTPGTYPVSFAAFGYWPDGLRVPARWQVKLVYRDTLADPPTLLERVLNGGRFHILQKIGTKKLTEIHIDEPAIVYQDLGLRGRASLLLPGLYGTAPLAVGDNTVTSIYVPEGYDVTLYDGFNLGGVKWTFSDSTNFVGLAADDRATMIEVSK